MAKQQTLGLSPDKQPTPTDGTYRPLKYCKTFRIAVSGDVRVTQTELKIIDTAEFQRLKGVRQLGPSIQVYPTALHTRFDHSLGTLQMAEDMIRAIHDARFQEIDETAGENQPLVISYEQHKLARLYALLHDITHVPFGHTLEDEFGLFASHDSAEAEDRFNHFLGEKSTIGKIISECESRQFYQRFITLIRDGKFNRLANKDEFAFHLVSDTVCADLLDYARRDSFFCNLELGLPYRFLTYLYVRDIPIDINGNGIKEERSRILVQLWKPKSNVPRRDVLTDLAGLLDARYMIAERVYFHPTKIVAGTMLGRAVFEAKRLGKLTEQDMWNHSDDTLVDYLARGIKSDPEENSGACQLIADLALGYKQRDFYKCIKKFSDESFVESQSTTSQEPLKDRALTLLRDPEQRSRTENEIAEMIGAKSGQILIYPADPKMNLKLAKVPVQWNGLFKALEDVEDPVLRARLDATKKAHKMLWGISLLGHPTLSEQQKQLAEHVFVAKFIESTTTESGRRRATEKLANVVRAEALKNNRAQNCSPQAFEEGIQKIAKELMEPTSAYKSKGGKVSHLQSLIQTYFDKL